MTPSWPVRPIALALVFLLNPLLYSWWHTTGGVFPDSVAYLQMSRDIVDHGKLFVAPVGHVDRALILPPLYPFVVGVFSAIHDDPLLVSQWINGAALLLCALPLFLWLERAANTYVAAAALIALQWQPFYIVYGTSTLTEAFFVLGTCAVACFAGVLLTRPVRPALPFFLLGAAAGALFLVRHIGVFLLPTLIGLLGLMGLLDWRRRAATAPTLLPALMIVLGFLAVLTPYGLALHAQTGHLPWTSSFRLNQYVVAAADPAPPAASPEAGASSYAEAYAERRALRRLLPDASEMEAYVEYPAAASTDPMRWLPSWSGWLRNLAANLRHLLNLAGGLTITLAAIGFVLSIARAGTGETRAWRLLIPALLFGYFVTLSAFAGLVERYAEVMLPLVIAQAAVGLYLLAAAAGRALPLSGLFWLGAAVIALGSIMLSAPASWLAKPLARKWGEAHNPVVACRRLVHEGEGIFSFHPLEAYLLGGTHRLVPNDSLDRIATYGRLTGTRWLFFRWSSVTATEAGPYQYADWLRDPSQLRSSQALVPRCGSPDLGVLFEIADDLPTPKTE